MAVIQKSPKHFFLGNYADIPRHDNYLIWQFMQYGCINGINGYVDHSGVNLSDIELRKEK